MGEIQESHIPPTPFDPQEENQKKNSSGENHSKKFSTQKETGYGSQQKRQLNNQGVTENASQNVGAQEERKEADNQLGKPGFES